MICESLNTYKMESLMGQFIEFSSPVQHLLKWAREKPDEVYLTQPLGDGKVLELTWAEVVDQARRGARHLVDLGLPEGSSIALLGRNSAHWFIADLAIWMAGHVTVPIYPTSNAETATYVLEHSEAKLLVLGKLDGVADSWKQVGPVLPDELPVITLPMAPAFRGQAWDDIVAGSEPLDELVDRDMEDLATIIYTSGTTGRPKGVMHCFRSLVAPAGCAAELWAPGEEDRMLSYLPLAHIGERVAVEIPSMIFGFQVFFNDSLETFVADLKRARPTRFFSVPRLWTKFYQAVNARIPPKRQRLLFAIPVLSGMMKRKILEGLGLDHVNVALTAAAPLSPEIIRWYRGLGLDLLEVFGMSENAATSHAVRIGEMRPGYVGTPLNGVECRIDESGEVLVKSPGQMLGYYKMPEETAAGYTEDGFFHTGDRGETDEAGRLRITGRTRDLFKTSKGKYVAPVPIENRLGAFPGLEAVCVTGPGHPQPFALVMLSPELPLPDDEAREAFAAGLAAHLDKVNSELEHHEQLACVVITREPWTIESGMLTPTMKIRRDVIEDHYLRFADEWLGAGVNITWE